MNVNPRVYRSTVYNERNTNTGRGVCGLMVSIMGSLVIGRDIKTLITKLIFYSDITSRRFFAGVCF